MSDEKSPIVLRVVVKQGEDAEEVQNRARAEHLAAHPEDAGRKFQYIVRQIVAPLDELQERAPFRHFPKDSSTARKTARGLVTWDNLTVILKGGRVLSGTYGYSDRYVTVKTAQGSKTTQIGGSHPYRVARIMLRELAEEGKAYGNAIPIARLGLSSAENTPGGGSRVWPRARSSVTTVAAASLVDVRFTPDETKCCAAVK